MLCWDGVSLINESLRRVALINVGVYTGHMSNYTSIEAAIIRQNVQDHNYQTARKLTRSLLNAGRVTYDQADKHNSGTAHILIDGETVGQASVLMPGMEYPDRQKLRGWK